MREMVRWMFVALLIFAGICTCHVCESVAFERFDLVSTDELKTMLDQRAKNQKDFILVNTLDELIFRDQSIPGSINIPWSQIEGRHGELGNEKNRLIITYCVGYRWVFSYKVAVAIKNHGYTNIKIYNGGLKEWVERNLPVERIEPLPEYDVRFVTNGQLRDMLQQAESTKCATPEAQPMLTILDLRTERIPEGAKAPVVIRTGCQTISGLLDDLLVEGFRNQIPRTSPVYVVTETGNRDAFAARFLYKYGFRNIFGLQFGMRGWLKADYPTVQIDAH